MDISKPVQHAQLMAQKHEGVQSAVSYVVGGGFSIGALIADMASYAQALAIIFGCAVVFIRAIHDAIRLYRLWKNK